MKSKEADNSLELLADGVMVLDPELKIIAFSEGAERITGYRREEVVNKRCYELFRSQCCHKDCPAKITFATGQVLSNQQYTIFTRDDDEIPISVSTSPLKDKSGKISAVVETFRNLAEVRDLMEKLSAASSETVRERNKLQAILNSINDGVFTVDMDFNIMSFNNAAEEITGFKVSEVLGKPCCEIFRSPLCSGNCPLKRTIHTGKDITNFELEIFNKDNSVVPLSVSIAVLKDGKGKVIGGVETFRDISHIKELTQELAGKYSFGNIIGKSHQMQKIYDLISDVSATSTTVLIEGDTGVGKELIARAIHYYSPRREKPFIVVNCAALPESLLESELFGHVKGAFTGAVSDRKGRFELADGGTIFLDEIGEMSPGVQAKLLRVLENMEFDRVGGTKTIKVDVRVISATNQNLKEKVAAKGFREDLYYRLNVVMIKILPLRERREDIPLLVEHFIALFNEKTGRSVTGVSQEVMDILLDHLWPGNVRQLENTIEHAFVHCRRGLVDVKHLPEEVIGAGKHIIEKVSSEDKPMSAVERELIFRTLKKNDWNKMKTARELEISRSSLWRKMKKYNIEEGVSN